MDFLIFLNLNILKRAYSWILILKFSENAKTIPE